MLTRSRSKALTRTVVVFSYFRRFVCGSEFAPPPRKMPIHLPTPAPFLIVESVENAPPPVRTSYQFLRFSCVWRAILMNEKEAQQ